MATSSASERGMTSSPKPASSDAISVTRGKWITGPLQSAMAGRGSTRQTLAVSAMAASSDIDRPVTKEQTTWLGRKTTPRSASSTWAGRIAGEVLKQDRTVTNLQVTFPHLSALR